MGKGYLTDEQVEREIERLTESPLVKLAKKDELIKYRRRQYLYKLRGYEIQRAERKNRDRSNRERVYHRLLKSRNADKRLEDQAWHFE